VSLRAKPGKAFQGFFVAVDGTDARGPLKGDWEVPVGSTDSKPVTFCATAGMTHTGAQDKTAVTVLWNPPANFTHGTVQFRATVVVNHDEFYTGVLSNPVKPDASVDTQSAYVQKQMASMFSNGGMMGGMNIQDLMSKMRSQMSQFQQGQQQTQQQQQQQQQAAHGVVNPLQQLQQQFGQSMNQHQGFTGFGR